MEGLHEFLKIHRLCEHTSRRIAGNTLGWGASDENNGYCTQPLVYCGDSIRAGAGVELHVRRALTEQMHLMVTAGGQGGQMPRANETSQPVPLFQLVARYYPAGSDDVRPLSSELAQCGRPAGRARDLHLP